MRSSNNTPQAMITTFGMLIEIFVTNGQISQAYQNAKAEGASALKELDLTTYALLIKAQCEVEGLAAAVPILDDARQMGLKPDDPIVSTLLTACFREAQVDLGHKIFEDHLAAGGRP